MILLDTLLTANTENEILEFKEAKSGCDIDLIGKYFSALSNEANLAGKDRAYILLGVKNDKSIVGTIISDSKINEIKLEIAKNTSPTISFIEIERFTKEKKAVLCCIIPASPQGMPVSWKGHYYGRDGESLGALNVDELERIRNQTKNSDWSIQIEKDAKIEDLSEEAISFARLQYSEKNQRLRDEIPRWDNKTFLNKAKLTINGKITNAAILLLGKPESEHFISPATARITWILKDKDGFEKDYEHFSCPFILSIKEIYKKIRNIKYRYIQDNSLFPEEVQQYDPYTIREALNNCIVHQDYTKGGKIILVENEDGYLIFRNSGDFIPGTIEKVIDSDAPEAIYRNPFLANAMVNLNMIDTIGSGIKRLFRIQQGKFFPLPEYDLSDHAVKLTITGKVLDLNYAKKLAADKTLSLSDIILLDKVQKRKHLTDSEFKYLKAKKLIEGRKNNYIIASTVAKVTHQEADYMKLRGITDDYCKIMIVDFIKKFGSARKAKMEDFFLSKLPDNLSEQQKKDKIKNILQALKRENKIKLQEKTREWVLSSSKEEII